MATTTARSNPLSYLTDQLNELKTKGTHFRLRVLDDEQAAVCTFDGKRVINLASNNYLGLTTHPKLRALGYRFVPVSSLLDRPRPAPQAPAGR